LNNKTNPRKKNIIEKRKKCIYRRKKCDAYHIFDMTHESSEEKEKATKM
jgi:hypothetical protein